MNYKHVYMLIINRAKSEVKEGKRPFKKSQRKNFPNQYFEFHHILPRSLFPNWESRQSNIVALTAREHFFCHQLLTKIYPKSNMIFALFLLCIDKQNNYCKINSKTYEYIKKEYSKRMSFYMKGKPNLKNRGKLSEEKKQKITTKIFKTMKQNGTFPIGEKNGMYNKHWKDHPEWKHPDRSGSKNPMYGNHRFAGENNPMYGKNVKDYMEPEAYENMRKKQGQKTAIRLRKKVICIEDNRIMESCEETCKIYKIPSSTLTRIIKNGRDCKACPGKHFKFIDS